MLEGKKIGVVIPAHNEEKLIGRVIETMPAFVDRMIVVDDCSTDGTRGIVEKLSIDRPDRVLLIGHDLAHTRRRAFLRQEIAGALLELLLLLA